MANALYARMQATAARLIKSYGQAGTVTRIAPPDPVNGGDPVETAYPATLVPMAYDARNIDGTVIKTGDVQIYISAVGMEIAPTVGDLITAAGAGYRIIDADPNNYDGMTNVVFIVHGRDASQ
ncbi:hypothetical protein [Pararhizobium sp. PWRC1-1]|uniref:hypothetical protein n=1 Tax=Pararhizobium sp. PWRC1-1 TaxID=2804566 RepID=UPI003CEC77D6